MKRALFPMLFGLALVVISLAVLFVPQPAAGSVPAALPGDSRYERLTLTAVGSTGAASGTVTGAAHMWGYVKAIYVDYGASVTNTTDVTISTAGVANTIMTKSNSATDAWFYPAVQFTNASGAAIDGAYGRFPIDDYVTISVAQSTSGTVATIYIYYGQ